MVSEFVIPSMYWVEDQEEKNRLIEEFKSGVRCVRNPFTLLHGSQIIGNTHGATKRNWIPTGFSFFIPELDFHFHLCYKHIVSNAQCHFIVVDMQL